MYRTLTTVLVLILLSVVTSVRPTICDKCACRYRDTDDDYLGDDIDCSYKTSILTKNLTLPSPAFSLDLSYNNLTVVTRTTLLQSKTLRELYLSNNALTDITTSALQLPGLKTLDLSFNDLELVNGDMFKDLKNLQYLNLANNRIRTFSKMTFHKLSNLNEIVLNNNYLGPELEKGNLFDRSGFGLTNKIEIVHLSGIHINKIPDNFFVDAYNIRKLVISNNNLTEIFEIPYTLYYLDISDNPIPDIYSEDFLDLPAMEVLKLNNLHIRSVPDFVFMELRGLKTLELERNKNLTEFSFLAFGREVLEDPEEFPLEELSLKSSRITGLDEKLIEPLGQLTKLDLQGNPWNCDCRLVWLKQLQINPHDYEHLRCATPKPLFNARVFDLKDKYFVCAAARHITGATIAIVTLCVMLTAIAVWIFVFVPRMQSRSSYIREMCHTTNMYSVLPTSPS